MGLAKALHFARRERGLSTRALAEAAGISQAYVVALERARDRHINPGPTPTLDVVARLAVALDIDPLALVRAGLQPMGRHVLLVVDDLDRVSGALSSQVTSPSAPWIWSSSNAAVVHPRSAARVEPLSIELRRGAPGQYDAIEIDRSLRAGLTSIRDQVRGHEIGLVFADTSKVMTSVARPADVTDLEHHWHGIVSAAAADAGAQAGWNVCVYAIGDLRRLDDPVTVAEELLDTHDTVWVSESRRTLAGPAAVRRLRSLASAA